MINKQEFLNLDKHIEKSKKRILALKHDWDGNEAPVVSELLITGTTSLLKHYFEYIFQEWGVIVQFPEINPCSDYSIDFSWSTENGNRMLINMWYAKSIINISYYGYSLKEGEVTNEINDSVISFIIKRDLALWMKNFLTN